MVCFVLINKRCLELFICFNLILERLFFFFFFDVTFVVVSTVLNLL